MNGTMTRSELTPRQREIYEYIYTFARDRGFQPSFRDIGAEFGIRSGNAILLHVKAMARKSYVSHSKGESRSIRFRLRPDGTPFRGFSEKADGA